ncbi:MAG: ketol-acid reductoisomerase [Planctomycetota bacterium]|jgi:ketol-acid reductoisomerase
MDLRILQGSHATPIEPLRGRTISVLGFGHQGEAHALNLRDSGLDVVVGNRTDTGGRTRAREHGFEVLSLADAAARADLAIIALPDEVQPDVYRKEVAAALRPGTTIGFLHGFCVHYRHLEPAADLGVIMVAPKGPGHALRRRFVEGRGIPCLFALHQDSPTGDAEAIGLAWAGAIGCGRAAVICTSFAHETETDLFGEQAVLCGGLTGLILAAFEILVEAGYAPELAYLECCHEVKQVADLTYERGLSGMMHAISNTAEFGAYRAEPVVIDETLRRRLRAMLDEIRSGAFAAALRADYEAGQPWLAEHRESLRRHAIEAAGINLRDLMPWLGDDPPGAG